MKKFRVYKNCVTEMEFCKITIFFYHSQWSQTLKKRGVQNLLLLTLLSVFLVKLFVTLNGFVQKNLKCTKFSESINVIFSIIKNIIK